jgi:septal ring factor EnvC (AmiA/AmiB activator)
MIKKAFGNGTVRTAVAILVAMGATFVATYNWKEAQDDKIGSNKTSIGKLEEFDKHTSETFKQINITLVDQRKVLMDTRETLVEVKTTQEGLQKAVDRLVLKLNGD